MNREQQTTLLHKRIQFLRRFADVPNMSPAVIEHTAYLILETFHSRPIAIARYAGYAVKSWFQSLKIQTQCSARHCYLRFIRRMSQTEVSALYDSEFAADEEFCRKVAEGKWPL